MTRTALLALTLLAAGPALAQRDSSTGARPEPREAAGGVLGQTESSNGQRPGQPQEAAGGVLAQTQSSNGRSGSGETLPRVEAAPAGAPTPGPANATAR